MGGRPSTMLDCMLQNFDQFCGQDLNMEASQLEVLCTSEWPTCGVCWPNEGTLNFGIIRAVHLM